MKKKIIIIIIAVLAVSAVLFIPFSVKTYKDGGTKEISALTYKIVRWNRISGDGTFKENKVYFLPDNFKDIDSLYEEIKPEEINIMTATVNLIEGNRVIADDVEFYLDEFNIPDLRPGNRVQIKYEGGIMESYPGRFEKIIEVIKIQDNSAEKYQGVWLNKDTAEKDNEFLSDLTVTEVYSDCFFATAIIPMPHMFKINYASGGSLCTGDRVKVEYKETWFDKENFRVEADIKSITGSTFEPEPGVCYKPVIYLYPEKQTEVSVKLMLNGSLTLSAPEYKEGWSVKAMPDGTLINSDGKKYESLFWEGRLNTDWDMSEGFCIKGSGTEEFLRKILPVTGLNQKETEEFIKFWTPLMQNNPYNIITFQRDLYENSARLEVTPKPDTVIRTFMAYKPSDEFINITPPEITTPERNGFTLTEWGGTEIK